MNALADTLNIHLTRCLVLTCPAGKHSEFGAVALCGSGVRGTKVKLIAGSEYTLCTDKITRR